jgi:hypothetical protein
MKFNKLLLQLIIGFMLAIGIIHLFFSGERKFDKLALGTETTEYRAKNIANESIHLITIDQLEEDEFINSYHKNGDKKVVLILGNSQTHSINQIKNEEVNYIRLLNEAFSSKGYEILCHSMPNAGMQEFYLSYMYWKNKLKIRSIVIPIFFDDLREDGIRNVFFPKLIEDRFLMRDSLSYIGNKINTSLKSNWSNTIREKDGLKDAIKSDNQALKETVQEGIENSLNRQLEQNVKSWNNRENVRGDFFVWLYQLRNTVLGINPGTVRKMIPQRYNDNMQALEFIIADCKKNDIKVLLYIPPIRSDVALPYDIVSYKAFKNEVKQICETEKGKLYFANFDTIIPGNLWGYKGATNLLEKREVDYMHFQFRGHQILADSLYNHINLMN